MSLADTHLSFEKNSTGENRETIRHVASEDCIYQMLVILNPLLLCQDTIYCSGLVKILEIKNSYLKSLQGRLVKGFNLCKFIKYLYKSCLKMRIYDFRKNGCFRSYNLGFLTKHGHIYTPLKQSTWKLYENEPVFQIDKGELPSHIRTLEVSKHSRLLNRDSQWPRRKWCLVVVAFIFIASVASLVASVLFWKSFNNTLEQNLNNTSKDESQEKEISEIEFVEKRTINAVLTGNEIDNTRQRCFLGVCREYSAFRYQSSCRNDYCQCSGQNYQTKTCLPEVGQCRIEMKALDYIDTNLRNVKQITYSCDTKTNVEKEIHVFSSYGNDFEKDSYLEVTDKRKFRKPLTLVLANYQKVSWKVVSHEAVIEEVILVSHHHLRRSSVVVQSKTKQTPLVTKIFSHVGYGQDKYGGHTVELLKTIYQHVGNISTFTGTSVANSWNLKLS